MCSEFYNAVLESWRGTYAWWREHNPGAEKFPEKLSQSHYDRLKMFTGVRADHPEWERLSVNVGSGVLCRFDRAARAFYKRCAEGKKPGFPRFKPRHRWRTIEIPDASTSMIVPPNTSRNGSAVWWRLRVKGVPRLRFRVRNSSQSAKPPSTCQTWPVTYEAASDPRNPTTLATSAGSPTRPRAAPDAVASAAAAPRGAVMSVAMNPGATTFTVMPRDPTSRATDFANPIRPAFEAA